MNKGIGNIPLHVEMTADRKRSTKTGKLKRRLPKVPPKFLRKYIMQNYVDALKTEIVARMKTATQLLIIDKLPEIEKQVRFEHPQGLTRRDSWSDDVQVQIQALESQYNQLAAQSAALAAGAFNEVNGQSHKDWYSTAKKVMGVDLLKYEPWISNQSKAFVQTNVGLIKKASSDTLHDINRIVMSGFSQGDRWESIRDRIMGTNLTTDAGGRVFPTLESRAELIARDQTLKLYGNLNQLRQTNTGLVWYIWKTVEDERVRGNPSGKYPKARPSHFSLNNKICRWDNPTVYADSLKAAEAGQWKKRESIKGVLLPPNQDFQCRCSAEAVFDTLFMDDGGQQTPEPPVVTPAPAPTPVPPPAPLPPPIATPKPPVVPVMPKIPIPKPPPQVPAQTPVVAVAGAIGKDARFVSPQFVGNMVDGLDNKSNKHGTVKATFKEIFSLGVIPENPKMAMRAKVKFRYRSFSQKYGQYSPATEEISVSTAIAKDSREVLTIAHEYGHHTDYRLIGKTDTFTSSFSGKKLTVPFTQTSEAKPLIDAMNKTQLAKDVRYMIFRKTFIMPDGTSIPLSIQNKKYFESYLLSDEEMFARAYSQYVATISPKTSRLRDALEFERKNSSGTLNQYQIWTDTDFEPIKKEFDIIFNKVTP